MTDIEQKALALVNEVLAEWGVLKKAVEVPKNSDAFSRALFRAIEQHEAFRQEVSDAVANWKNMSDFSSFETMLKLAEQDLFGFIIPKPKPDPLVEVVKGVTWYDNEITAKEIRAALEARGLEIREKNDD